MSRRFPVAAALFSTMGLLSGTCLASGTYLGASLGSAEFGSNPDKVDAWAIHGGYGFTEWFALEASYADFETLQEYSCDEGCGIFAANSVHARSLEVAAVISWLPIDRVELFGKAGLARREAEFHDTSAQPGSSSGDGVINRRDTGILYGAGVSLGMNRYVSLRLQVMRQHNEVGDITSAWAGMTVRLGR